MKCDELKPLVFSLNDLSYVDELEVEKNFENPHDHAVYKATEVDAAIAELNDKLHDVDNQWNEQCKEIAELKAENERLKAKLADAIATAAFNYLDAVTRERRLRRALWLARALRARDIQRWWIAATCAPTTERACSVWNNVECKCLKKVEQYR